MFKSPFPPSCAFRLVRSSEYSEVASLISKLHPHEIEIFQAFKSDDRKKEFACGRLAARLALGELSEDSEVCLARLDSGAVNWPVGFVGSIAHSAGVAVAVVSRVGEFRSLGVDIQFTKQKRDPKLLGRIASAKESAWVGSGDESNARMYRLFSAKESAYKALHPLCGIHLSFRDVECNWSSSEGEFSMVLQRTLSDDLEQGRAFSGVSSESDNYVLTGIMID